MASTDSTAIPIKNQAYRIYFPIMDADGDLVTGASGLDSEISKDGGTFTDVTSEAIEIATASGMYYLDLTSTEMNADTVILIVKSTTTGAKTTPLVLYPAEPTDIIVNVKAISDDTTAPDNIELDYDGTGYAKTNSTIGTCTTNTDMVDAPTVTQIRQEMDTNSVDLNSILGDTNELQTNQGNWITATGFSTHNAVDVWSSATRSLTDKSDFDLSTTSINLIWDNLLSGMTQVGSIGKLIADNLNAAITTRSILNEYDVRMAALQTDLDNPNQYKADVSNLALETTLTSIKGSTFNTTTDSLEAIRNRGDGNWLSATGFSTHSASDTWSVANRTITDKTGFSLSSIGIKAIWDQLTSALTTVGSLGKLVVDNINATISSRSPSSEYDTEMGRLDIAVSTRNSITPDIVGTAATLHGITDAKIDVVDSIVDAIKLQTDNLPSGITKGEALPKFDFLMVLSSDHITSATGKTVIGTISKDGGAFTAITNIITEVSNGMYTIASGFTSTEMNADIITLQFNNVDCDTRTITIITN